MDSLVHHVVLHHGDCFLSKTSRRLKKGGDFSVLHLVRDRPSSCSCCAGGAVTIAGLYKLVTTNRVLSMAINGCVIVLLSFLFVVFVTITFTATFS